LLHEGDLEFDGAALGYQVHRRPQALPHGLRGAVFGREALHHRVHQDAFFAGRRTAPDQCRGRHVAAA